jgi:hypothetical protein
MNYIMLMQMAYSSHQLGEYSSDEPRGQRSSIVRDDFEQVAAWAVVQNQEGALFVAAKSLQLYKGWMIQRLEDFDFAFQGHLQSLLIGSTSWSMFNDLYCN